MHPLNCTVEIGSDGSKVKRLYEIGDIPNFVILGEKPEDFAIVGEYN